MRARSLITLAVGLATASGSVLVAHQYMTGQRAGEAIANIPQIPMANVVVARSDLAFGQAVRFEHLREQEWPAHAVPEGSFGSIKQIIGEGNDLRVALRPISPGEPVLQSKVSGFGERASLSAIVPDGKRAFSIKVNEVTGVSGFLLPGDRVDILLTRSVGDNRNLATDVILQDIIVRAIDQTSDEQRDRPQVAKTVTVEVTPDEAQKLALAMQVGSLSLALRNVHAVDKLTGLKTVGVRDLVDGERRPAQPTVRVRRGPSEFAVETVR